MLTGLGDLVAVLAHNGEVQQRVEVGDDARGHGVSQAVVLGVDQSDLGAHALKEGEGAGVHRTGSAIGHEEDVGLTLGGNLERAVEVLTGVVGGGVDPLHLGEQEGGVRISHLLGGTGSHEVDHLVVLEVLGELLGELLAGLSSVLAELKDVGEAGDHVLVVVIALGLLKDLDSKSDGVAGLLALGSEVGVEAVNDDVVSVDGQSGASLVSEGDDRAVVLLGGLVGLDGLGRGATEGAGDHEGVLVDPGRRVVVELVSGEDLNVQLVRVVGQEVLGGVKVGHGGTAADEGDAVDLVVGQDVSDDLLREVKVDLVHLTHSFQFLRRHIAGRSQGYRDLDRVAGPLRMCQRDCPLTHLGMEACLGYGMPGRPPGESG